MNWMDFVSGGWVPAAWLVSKPAKTCISGIVRRSLANMQPEGNERPSTNIPEIS